MAQVTVDQAIAIAMQHHQAGRLSEAESLYRQVLAHQANHPDALHLLGVIAFQVGKLEMAAELLNRSIILRPGFADAYSNLGNVLKAQGKFDAAVAAYSRAIGLKPAFPEAHNNLANALIDQGNVEAAVAAYARAVQLSPGFAMAYSNLANALTHLGRLDEAIVACQNALRLAPDYPDAHFHLGNAFKDQGKFAEAIVAYKNLIRLRPDHSSGHNNLGAMYREESRLDEAEAEFSKAIQCDPQNAPAHNNLGNSLKDRGDLNQAIACYKRTLELAPSLAQAHSNLVYTLHFHPESDAANIHAALRQWNERHSALPLKRFITPHRNDRNPDRRIKIGYVSADFSSHPVGRIFLLPVVEHHDHAHFDIFFYADVRCPDALTDRFRVAADTWRNIVGLSDERVAQLVAQDGIDILIDLTMHMANSRLLVFARKPAPVQVTWLAYPGSTGMEAVDYRITDRFLDPITSIEEQELPGIPQPLYSEEPVRLPDCWCCYRPPADTPKVGPLPSLAVGNITFGCLNNICKVTREALLCWSRLLCQTPQTRLILHVPPGDQRRAMMQLMQHQGVEARRVTCIHRVPLREYFDQYNQIDIGLDPFPYSGGTTSCDALWMGVPLVTLSGRTAAGRGTATLLHNVGLPELVATSQEEYIQIAKELRQDSARLGSIRSALRQKMQASPLMDEPGFTRNVESAYRDMWRRWCKDGGRPVRGF